MESKTKKAPKQDVAADTRTNPNRDNEQTDTWTSLEDHFRYPPESESSVHGNYQALSALTNSSSWAKATSPTTTKAPADVDLLLKKATRLYERRHAAKDYRDSMAVMWYELCSLRERLQNVQDITTHGEGAQTRKVSRALADLYGELGDYDKAEAILYASCPNVPNKDSVFRSSDFEVHVDIVLHYLEFCAWTGRQRFRAKLIAKTLPWIQLNVLQTSQCKLSVLLHLIRILNEEGAGEEAVQTFWVVEHIIALTEHLHSGYLTQRAICSYQERKYRRGRDWFTRSLLLTALRHGLWHRSTLDTLFHFGRNLRLSDNHEAAAQALVICYQGFLYTFGSTHPLAKRTFEELKACKNGSSQVQNARRLNRQKYPLKRLLSLAFEYYYLVTIIDVLKLILSLDYAMIINFIDEVTSRSSTEWLATGRLRAQCAYEEGQFTKASSILQEMRNQRPNPKDEFVSEKAFNALLVLDSARFSADHDREEKATIAEMSKSIFAAFDTFKQSETDQVEAFRRRLTVHGLDHFKRDVLFAEPPLILELNEEPIGWGSYALVDAVKVGHTLYARKSINLGRMRRKQTILREAIKKEVQIMRALDHPHVVSVFLTYEETTRFCILMHPLAECTLEGLLDSKFSKTEKDTRRVWQWMGCLANTLAFVHCQDVRHKDIKPRNILIKGDMIYLADFGSSHIFADDGASTTEGIAFGHTKAYSAPEVIAQSSRNRSTDVFSLGCVFAEMFVWIHSVKISSFQNAVRSDDQTPGSFMYYLSIAEIKDWFEGSKMNPGRDTGNHVFKMFYMDVLRRMVRTKPESRWKAGDISWAVNKSQDDDSVCAECPTRVWVPVAQTESDDARRKRLGIR